MEWLRQPTPVRRLRWIRSIGLASVAIAIGLLPVLVPCDAEGTAIAIGLCVLCCAGSIWNGVLARQTGRETVIQHGIEVLAPSEQLGKLRKMIWSTPLVFGAISVWNACALTQDHVPVMQPAALIYGMAGYGPAVLFYPVLGLVLTLGIWRRLQSISRETQFRELANQKES